jgi:hypothetical protein
MGHLLKLKYALGTLERAYFSFHKCPKFITETNYSVVHNKIKKGYLSLNYMDEMKEGCCYMHTKAREHYAPMERRRAFFCTNEVKRYVL